MQETVYKCDQCLKEIGNKPHISMQCQKNLTGISMPPGSVHYRNILASSIVKNENWQVNGVDRGFLHFCDTQHMKLFFDALMKEAINPKKK